MIDSKEDPGTWEDTLKTHWDIFTAFAWRGFSAFEEETRKIGHQNKVDKMKWREYLLWDMQKRHNQELGKPTRNQNWGDLPNEVWLTGPIICKHCEKQPIECECEHA